MRLVLESDPRLNLVRRYGEGEIVIGEQRITHPVLVTPQQLVLDWSVGNFAELGEPDLAPVFALGAQIVLIGIGDRQQLPSAAVRSSFRTRAIALECMTLGAACRTYNILASEARPVAAMLFPNG
jgi:uncharacterized protein